MGNSPKVVILPILSCYLEDNILSVFYRINSINDIFVQFGTIQFVPFVFYLNAIIWLHS